MDKIEMVNPTVKDIKKLELLCSAGGNGKRNNLFEKLLAGIS